MHIYNLSAELFFGSQQLINLLFEVLGICNFLNCSVHMLYQLYFCSY